MFIERKLYTLDGPALSMTLGLGWEEAVETHRWVGEMEILAGREDDLLFEFFLEGCSLLMKLGRLVQVDIEGVVVVVFKCVFSCNGCKSFD